MFGVIKWLKGRKGGDYFQRAHTERRGPVLGWFILSGDEGFRKSIVLRFDRATEIENSRAMGIMRSMASSADGFAPPVLSVGLNLKTKRLVGNHEFPGRESPERDVRDGGTHHPCSWV